MACDLTGADGSGGELSFHPVVTHGTQAVNLCLVLAMVLGPTVFL